MGTLYYPQENYFDDYNDQSCLNKTAFINMFTLKMLALQITNS